MITANFFWGLGLGVVIGAVLVVVYLIVFGEDEDG